jgi:hypothetical protein
MIESFHKTLLEKGPGRVSPFFIPGIIPNMLPGQIAIEYGAMGPNSSIKLPVRQVLMLLANHSGLYRKVSLMP